MPVTEHPDCENETVSRELAEEYLGLGGRRRSKINGNDTDIQDWEEDPPEPEAFWLAEIEPLDEERRKEVELFWPSIKAR
jgi:hypothetical protein